MSAAAQHELLRVAFDLLDGRPDAWTRAGDGLDGLPPPEQRRACFASGLTAAIVTLARRNGVDLPPGLAGYGDEQCAAVAARQARFAEVLPRVLAALHHAGVEALPVKGAVLAGEVWPMAGCRPMSDIDVLVAPAQRDRAATALEAAGFRRTDRAPWEDTFLAWGDGSVGRIDGESADHNGKIEVHPGWVERLHNYLVDDGGLLLAEAGPGTLAGVPCRRLDRAAFALHVVGHLSATVVRAEVRPLHVLDAWWCLSDLAGATADQERFARLAGSLDARLVAPGLWLVERHRPGSVPAALLEESIGRLGARAAARLASTEPRCVLRDPTRRTAIGWRTAFATSRAERRAMARQIVLPPAVERRGSTAVGLQLRRLGRAVDRGTATLRRAR